MAPESLVCRAPTRIDFVGGWTDVQPFCDDDEGMVINAAVNIHARVRIQRSTSPRAPTDPFIRAAARRLELQGATVELDTAAPIGSGLGGSGAVGVALVSGVSEFAGIALTRREIAEIAHAIEVEDLNVIGGRQDQYAAAFGGFLAMTFKGDGVEVAPIILPPARVAQLQASSVLVYSGMAHLSGDVHSHVQDAFRSRVPATLEALATIRRVARNFQNHLPEGSLEELGALLSENWQAQKRLHPATTTETVDRLFRIAQEHRALGGKALGAGGGGCLYFLAPEGETKRLADALAAQGATRMPFSFDMGGVYTERIS